MQTTINQQPTKKHWWGKDKSAGQAISTPVQQIIAPALRTSSNFYERAIEWTHRADKIINLVLGYALAIASVLGFMDVLSNGQVLSTVPYLFYIWLAIMGLGVDFQILLVIGRIPDLFHMPVAGWQKWLIFCFNILFLIFLCVMSVVISAVFTQHHDMPTKATMSDAMSTLSIDSILFVYGRAALATLLLVLMAVDRTMERWRMQIIATQLVASAAQTTTPVQQTATPALQVSDLDKMLQAVVTMNQQNLAQMQAMNQQAIAQVSQVTISLVEETVNRLTATLSLPSAPILAQLGQGEQEGEQGEQKQQGNGDTGPLALPGTPVRPEQNQNFLPAIEALLANEPGLTDREIADRVGCSVGTANKWKKHCRVSA